MDILVVSTIVLAIWGALGPLVGVRYGSELSNRAQRKQWLAENAKQECSELINVMAQAFTTIGTYYANTISLPMSRPRSAEDLEELHLALKSSHEIFYSKFVIQSELERRDIRNRWIGAIGRYENDSDTTHFAEEFGTLAKEIREIAASFIT